MNPVAPQVAGYFNDLYKRSDTQVIINHRLDQRLRVLEHHLSQPVNIRFDALEARVANLEQQQQVLATQLEEHITRIIDRHNAMVDRLIAIEQRLKSEEWQLFE